MKLRLFLTGHSGFLGKNFINSFKNEYNFNFYLKNSEICIKEDVVVHLAGKAHDLKNALNPDEYYRVNTELTRKIFDAFLTSNAEVFITISSIKAVADVSNSILTEEQIPNPISHYGKSKLFAEQYILSKIIPEGKRIYILRPCMIHGIGNKGNLNLLYKFVSLGIPWPLGSFENKRSFCSVDNLMFLIKELIERKDIPSGIYNVADDEVLSTNDLIRISSESLFKKPIIFNLSPAFIKLLAKVGDLFFLPLTTDRLHKLTETCVVDNSKIKSAIKKPFPTSARDGLFKTFQSFKKIQ